MSKTDLNSRLYVVFLFFILIFFILIARLIYVQLIKSAELKSYARQQHAIYTEISPLRGTIFDRNHKELAVNRNSYSIFATKELLSPNSKLSALLDLDDKSLAAKLNQSKNFVWLKRKVSPEISTKIEQLHLEGVGQVREHKRFYPDGSLASHLLGFANIDNKGLEGIELYCDSYLAGVKGWRLSSRDAKRRELICWGYKSILPADGYDLVLTVDRVIQSIAERHLRAAARKYKASSATAIVMQPSTGEILALCNYPDYDLNNFTDYPAEVRRNLALTDIFEPGSSFKFVTAAAALEEGLVDPEDKFFCEQGEYRIGRRILHDYKPYGEITFREIVVHSSNIGMAKVAQLLGKELLYSYIKSFGFGELTGIDLPGEVKGIIRSPQFWSKASIYSLPMGQEVAVTCIQLIRAISCVANDGILVKPQIVKSIQRNRGEIIKSYNSQKVRRVMSVKTAQVLKQILTGVVEEGTGKKAKVPGYLTAGKTGTAQKVNPAGGYYKRKYYSSFVGFVPADRPQLSILVVMNEPYPRYFGGTVCAPVFRKIATETLRYLESANETKEVTAGPEAQTLGQLN
ncbi:peptidoglycan D,D-transpeptidase FtsI family protein [Candidatus Omnitrophota bacterium]